MAKSLDEMIAVMTAAREGKQIQTESRIGKWVDCIPTWDWTSFDYRVKPARKIHLVMDEETAEKMMRLLAKGMFRNDLYNAFEDAVYLKGGTHNGITSYIEEVEE